MVGQCQKKRKRSTLAITINIPALEKVQMKQKKREEKTTTYPKNIKFILPIVPSKRI